MNFFRISFCSFFSFGGKRGPFRGFRRPLRPDQTSLEDKKSVGRKFLKGKNEVEGTKERIRGLQLRLN